MIVRFLCRTARNSEQLVLERGPKISQQWRNLSKIILDAGSGVLELMFPDFRIRLFHLCRSLRPEYQIEGPYGKQ